MRPQVNTQCDPSTTSGARTDPGEAPRGSPQGKPPGDRLPDPRAHFLSRRSGNPNRPADHPDTHTQHLHAPLPITGCLTDPYPRQRTLCVEHTTKDWGRGLTKFSNVGSGNPNFVHVNVISDSTLGQGSLAGHLGGQST